MEIISQESLRKNEIKYFEELFDQYYSKLEFQPAELNLKSVEDNSVQTNLLKKKYPFFIDIIAVLREEEKEHLLKTKISNLIVDYLKVIYIDGNIIVDNGNFKSVAKRKYSKEKENIVLDLKKIIIEAMDYVKIEKESINLLKISQSKDDQNEISTEDDEISKSNKTNKLISVNFNVDTSFITFTETLKKCEIFDNNKMAFILVPFARITSLQSFQYLLTYFVLEFLQRSFSEVNIEYLYSRFNETFSIVRNGEKQFMTSQNWTGFNTAKVSERHQNEFYMVLFNQMQNNTAFQSKQSKQI